MFELLGGICPFSFLRCGLNLTWNFDMVYACCMNFVNFLFSIFKRTLSFKIHWIVDRIWIWIFVTFYILLYQCRQLIQFVVINPNSKPANQFFHGVAICQINAFFLQLVNFFIVNFFIRKQLLDPHIDFFLATSKLFRNPWLRKQLLGPHADFFLVTS